MSTSITRIPANGITYKAPHFTKRLTSTLYFAYRTGHKGTQQLTQYLAKAIDTRTFSPFFDQKEIDDLFARVLANYGKSVKDGVSKGRYEGETFATPERWNALFTDLLNNKAAVAIATRAYLRENPKAGVETRLEAIQDLQASLREIKIVEDWVYYHYNELRTVIDQTINPA